MSPVEAAGYAMAPSHEDMAQPELDELSMTQPEVALRNGHAEAAEQLSKPFLRLQHIVADTSSGRLHGVRDYISGLLGGRAHA
jgi:hypothetical protein